MSQKKKIFLNSTADLDILLLHRQVVLILPPLWYFRDGSADLCLLLTTSAWPYFCIPSVSPLGLNVPLQLLNKRLTTAHSQDRPDHHMLSEDGIFYILYNLCDEPKCLNSPIRSMTSLCGENFWWLSLLILQIVCFIYLMYSKVFLHWHVCKLTMLVGNDSSFNKLYCLSYWFKCVFISLRCLSLNDRQSFLNCEYLR